MLTTERAYGQQRVRGGISGRRHHGGRGEASWGAMDRDESPGDNREIQRVTRPVSRTRTASAPAAPIGTEVSPKRCNEPLGRSLLRIGAVVLHLRP